MLGSPENTAILFRRENVEGGAVDPKQPHLSRRKFMQGAAIMGAAPLMSSHAFSTSDRVPPQSPEGTVPKKTLDEQVFRCRHSTWRLPPGFREYRSDCKRDSG